MVLVHHRVITPSIEFADTHLYTWVERATMRVKCLAQDQNTVVIVPRPELEHGLADLESNAVTMRPLHLLVC